MGYGVVTTSVTIANGHQQFNNTLKFLMEFDYLLYSTRIIRYPDLTTRGLCCLSGPSRCGMLSEGVPL